MSKAVKKERSFLGSDKNKSWFSDSTDSDESWNRTKDGNRIKGNASDVRPVGHKRSRDGRCTTDTSANVRSNEHCVQRSIVDMLVISPKATTSSRDKSNDNRDMSDDCDTAANGCDIPANSHVRDSSPQQEDVNDCEVISINSEKDDTPRVPRRRPRGRAWRATLKNHKKITCRSRYTAQERRSMVNYLIERKSIHLGKGYIVWQKMIDDGILTHRTTQSLQNEFRKRILPSIDRYPDLNPRILAEFVALRPRSRAKR